MITKIQAKNNENFHLAFLSTVDKDGKRDIVHRVYKKYKLKNTKGDCFILDLDGKIEGEVIYTRVEENTNRTFISSECPICHPEAGTKIDESDLIADLYRKLDSDENKEWVNGVVKGLMNGELPEGIF